MAHPLVTSDDWLYSDEPPHVRVVAAATFGYPKRNPSLAELVKVTGLNRHTVKDAQNRLEAWSRTGTTAIAPLAQYDKPANWYERNPDNPRFHRSNKLERVFRPDYDPDRAKYRIELPASVLAKLPRGQKNSAILRLVALCYARDQLRRGAIQTDDATLAEELQLRVQRKGFHEETNVAQVTRARETLLRRGVLVVHDADADPPIYTMPGATPGKPENPDELVPEATKKLRQHPLAGGDRLDVQATEQDWNTIQNLIRVLGDDAATEAIWDAGIDPLCDGTPAKDVIAALAAACPPDVRDTYVKRSGHLSPTLGAPSQDVRSTGELLPIPSTETSSVADAEREPKVAEHGPDKDEGSGEGSKSLLRREWGAAWSNLYYFTDADETHQRIERIIAAVEKKHGHAEAVAALHDAVRPGQGRATGTTVLRRLRDSWAYLVPEEGRSADVPPEADDEDDAGAILDGDFLDDVYRPPPE